MPWPNHNFLSSAGVDLSTHQTHTNDFALFTIPGGQPAIDIWHKLSSNSQLLGGWPFLGGDAQNNPLIIGKYYKPTKSEQEKTLSLVPITPPLDALTKSKLDRRALMLERIKKHALPSLIEALTPPHPTQPSSPPKPDFSNWPKKPQDPTRRHIASVFDFKGNPLPQCLLQIVRTKNAADIPAFLPFGHFNDCPPPEIHIAFLRDWHRRFAAVPIAMTHDVIELYLPNPILDRETAFQVALEQYEYAPDIVDQGTETVDRLGAEIWGSHYWFFWWD